MAYASEVGAQNFPVFADPNRAYANATPMTQAKHPEMCAIAPDMTIIQCFDGHGAHFNALAAIKQHAGL